MRLVDRPHRVYRHYSAAGELLYIGVTSKITERNLGHRMTSAWWPTVAYVTLSEPMAREDAMALEVHLINRHRPPFNRRVTQRSTFTMRGAA